VNNRRSLAVVAIILAAGLAGCVQVVGPGASGSPGPGGTPAGPGGTPAGPGGTPAGPGGNPAGLAGAFVAFVKDNDLWVVTADGSRSIQLTSDGSTGAYTNPTVAPDGTIYVLRGENTLYHFDLAGRVIGAPAQLAVLENGAEGLSVAPDGAHLAYVTTGWGTYIDPRFGTYSGQYIYGGTDVMTPDGHSVPGAAMGSMLYPSWAGTSTLVLSDGTTVYVDSVPQPEPTAWLYINNGCLIPSLCPDGEEPDAHLSEAVVNRDATVLAYIYKPYYGNPPGRRMLSLAGPPPGDATVRCVVEGQENYRDPGSFSVDGSLFAYDDTIFDPDTLETTAGQGVYVMTVDLNAPDCGASTARLVAPGAFQPDFSPAL
jgi:hypothetical protein